MRRAARRATLSSATSVATFQDMNFSFLDWRQDMGILANKAVVITGAAQGLGRAHALAAASAGARVVVNDIDADRVRGVADEIRSNGGTAVAHIGSVSDYAASAEMV